MKLILEQSYMGQMSDLVLHSLRQEYNEEAFCSSSDSLLYGPSAVGRRVAGFMYQDVLSGCMQIVELPPRLCLSFPFSVCQIRKAFCCIQK